MDKMKSKHFKKITQSLALIFICAGTFQAAEKTQSAYEKLKDEYSYLLQKLGGESNRHISIGYDIEDSRHYAIGYDIHTASFIKTLPTDYIGNNSDLVDTISSFLYPYNLLTKEGDARRALLAQDSNEKQEALEAWLLEQGASQQVVEKNSLFNFNYGLKAPEEVERAWERMERERIQEGLAWIDREMGTEWDLNRKEKLLKEVEQNKNMEREKLLKELYEIRRWERGEAEIKRLLTRNAYFFSWDDLNRKKRLLKGVEMGTEWDLNRRVKLLKEVEEEREREAERRLKEVEENMEREKLLKEVEEFIDRRLKALKKQQEKWEWYYRFLNDPEYKRRRKEYITSKYLYTKSWYMRDLQYEQRREDDKARKEWVKEQGRELRELWKEIRKAENSLLNTLGLPSVEEMLKAPSVSSKEKRDVEKIVEPQAQSEAREGNEDGAATKKITRTDMHESKEDVAREDQLEIVSNGQKHSPISGSDDVQEVITENEYLSESPSFEGAKGQVEESQVNLERFHRLVDRQMKSKAQRLERDVKRHREADERLNALADARARNRRRREAHGDVVRARRDVADQAQVNEMNREEGDHYAAASIAEIANRSADIRPPRINDIISRFAALRSDFADFHNEIYDAMRSVVAIIKAILYLIAVFVVLKGFNYAWRALFPSTPKPQALPRAVIKEVEVEVEEKVDEEVVEKHEEQVVVNTTKKVKAMVTRKEDKKVNVANQIHICTFCEARSTSEPTYIEADELFGFGQKKGFCSDKCVADYKQRLALLFFLGLLSAIALLGILWLIRRRRLMRLRRKGKRKKEEKALADALLNALRQK